ncbi:PTS system mannose/fructose/sorbose family transporter subunit IID [Lactobacillus sp. ESL0791]|uniref:PTS system mannose/fructose/sorbose family transporter subunit IID n=1 Tax=Lactobacillus sp. ESL0791 TaxID=2983234 RepID=UPI0023F74C69|nr:PTS system mannose/fructose/sorbose family transporter subunit IID [Lactobacillus sp. ESL0791]MDF7638095.1 PTS system mannose/fructose/sorbose family transporter subunit IID [Lactobacillus sp. ESL0791]
MSNKKIENKLTKKDIFQTFVFENFQQASFNYERIHALAFCVDMIPTIRRVYKNKKDQAAALKRHNTFFNVTPGFCGPVVGMTSALEQAKAQGEDINVETINSLKVGLMGPLCGVGDPVMWGTLRPILAALGATLALQGSWLGPIVFFVVFNLIRLAFKWYGLKIGLDRGMSLVQDLSGNLLKKLTEGATILGLFVMGVLVNKWTTINIPVVISKTTVAGKTTITTVQNILDQLCPGLAALGMTLLMMYLLKKRVSPILLIFVLFGVGILGYWLGILR